MAHATGRRVDMGLPGRRARKPQANGQLDLLDSD
jgi:hypothetical protein